ncbi:response regulator [Blastococcus sp. TF02-9]|uniref:hybrid sensor histidine kinase/response regulator n=1 Tax=Blastococcus sp. TF02-09 TaxID=2250576 RepID=UPI0013145D22|nr:response regulator [Blastococcus sp. TF02-9]
MADLKPKVAVQARWRALVDLAASAGWALAYAVTVFLGRMTRVDGSALALVWPAAAVGVLWLACRWQRRRWLVTDAVLLAVVAGAVNVVTGTSALMGAFFGLANVVQSLIACVLLRGLQQRWGSVPWRLRRSADLGALVIASSGASLAAAGIGPVALWWLQDVPLMPTMGAWTLRNAAGTFVFVALALRVADRQLGRVVRDRRQAAELGFAAAVVVAGYTAVFGMTAHLPVGFLLVPLSMWLALRFHTTVAAAHVMLTGFLVVTLTLADRGPFAIGDPLVQVLLAQAFVTVTGLVALVLALHRDERAQLIGGLEEARRRADEQAALVERAGAARTAFLATMSHEIRTPLNAVLGLTDVLLTTDLGAEQRDHLETIAGSGDALLSLINDILDFSKIEAGELALERAPFELDDVVYDVAQLMSPQAAAKGLNLIVDVPPDGGWHVLGDAPRLRQVLLNLVGNAIKFTAHGVVLVKVTATVEGCRMVCRLAVSDTGIGIPADQHDRLFRSFSQVDASTTRSYGGTGLGLAISQRIAEAMGGGITVDSEPDVGSTFTVSVRLQVPATAPVRTDGDALAGCRVLVVDDNPDYVTLLGRKLARFGATCVPATSGAEALAVAEREGASLDAALLGTDMPGMPADELAERLRAQPTTAELPLVLLSTSSLLPPERAHLFVARLTKPVRPERLLHALQAALRREPTAAPPAPRARPGTPADRRRLRVLVAEDNPVNARLMAMYLRQLGHDGDHVPNGEEAVRAVLSGAYDVVLMDAQMPVLGGVDATAAIRAMPGPQPRIVAVTASALATDRTAFLEAGADDFVTKPVRMATLAAALEAPWDGTERRALSGGSATATVPTPRAEDDAPTLHAVLDAATVAELRDLGDEGFAHLYREYLTGMDAMVAAILAAPVPPVDEDASMARLAHKLKGSSAAMGATGLAEICGRLEDVGVPDTALAAVLQAQSDRVRAAVGALLADIET